MKLASILSDNRIFINIPAMPRKELYTYMLEQAAATLSFQFNADEFAEQMTSVEDLTRIPYEGVAMPHIRSSECDDLYIIIGLLSEPATLKDSDLKPTQVVVMSLISSTMSDIYLKALSAFARYFCKKGVLDEFAQLQTPTAVIDKLDSDNVSLKKSITAEDIMYKNPLSLSENETLKVGLNTFTEATRTIPVVDDNGCLVGVLDALELIKKGIPPYLMMMDNFKILKSFEPFQKIIDNEEGSTVKEHLSPAQMILSPDTPLIQLTIALVKREADTIIIADENKKLLGVITIDNLVHKILRG